MDNIFKSLIMLSNYQVKLTSASYFQLYFSLTLQRCYTKEHLGYLLGLIQLHFHFKNNTKLYSFTLFKTLKLTQIQDPQTG